MNREALAMLALQVANLQELQAWPPLAALLQDLAAAAEGCGGITDQEIRRLRMWSARASRLRPDVRAFYARHASEQLPSAALWSILDNYDRPSPTSRGILKRMFADEEGYEPAFTLCPVLRGTR